MIFQLREDITHVDNVMQSAKERPTFESSLLISLSCYIIPNSAAIEKQTFLF